MSIISRRNGLWLSVVFSVFSQFVSSQISVAQSDHVAETVTPRLKLADDFYLKFDCIIASGNASADVDALLAKTGVLDVFPGYGVVKTLASELVRIVALKRGSTYCFVSKWNAEIDGKLVSRSILISQKQYTAGLIARSHLNRTCGKVPICFQVLKGSDNVDGATTCAELPKGKNPTVSSVVVAIGKATNLIDADQNTMDKPCSARKF